MFNVPLAPITSNVAISDMWAQMDDQVSAYSRLLAPVSTSG